MMWQTSSVDFDLTETNFVFCKARIFCWTPPQPKRAGTAWWEGCWKQWCLSLKGVRRASPSLPGCPQERGRLGDTGSSASYVGSIRWWQWRQIL